MTRRIETDVLVIGGGGAGARAALAADDAGSRCVLLTKGPVAHSGATPMACPSYQATAMGVAGDTVAQAFEDTMAEGRGLADEPLALAMVAEAGERARDLERYGVRFRRDGERFLQVTHPGQSHPRNLVIKGAGYSMMFHLRRELERRTGVALVEDAMVTTLAVRDGRVVGAVAVDLHDGSLIEVAAHAVVLATGGYPELWWQTDTTPELTGDGQALALWAGAELVDLEMMLWYPTCLTSPEEIVGTLVQYEGLITPEYCGGKLLNGLGREFLPPGRPPVRDVMMKLMFTEIDEGRATASGGLAIDLAASPKPMSEIRRLLRRLDSLPYRNLADLGIDIATEPIEVAPATHFTIGGVRIDEWGRTSVPGLYACGEAAGNAHGANRTSGNALAETQVYGQRAGRVAAEEAADGPHAELDVELQREADRVAGLLAPGPGCIRPRLVKQRLKHVVHTGLGHRRDESGMRAAVASIVELRSEMLPRVRASTGQGFMYELQEALEVRAMLDLAEAVALSAIERTESRGHHWRTDFPEATPGSAYHTSVVAERDRLRVGRQPVLRLTAPVGAKASSHVV